MDTSDEDITFDENGVCMRCNEYKERILPEWNYGKGHDEELRSLIKQIKESGKGKSSESNESRESEGREGTAQSDLKERPQYGSCEGKAWNLSRHSQRVVHKEPEVCTCVTLPVFSE